MLVPRLFDAENTNAQSLNAKALLACFRRTDVTWMGLHYDLPDTGVVANSQVRLSKLWRRHLWPWHAMVQYQRSVDAIFYPGAEWFDDAGLKWRSRLGRRVPVIATLEGLAGDADTESVLSEAAGHAVHCHRVERPVLERVRAVLDRADHVIAISPFLARMGRVLYGDKFFVLPLGVDLGRFHPRSEARRAGPVAVVSIGRVASHKRPGVFLHLAARFPQVRFQWFGEGPDRAGLIAEAASRRLGNLDFPGARRPSEIAEALRLSDIFVLPSLSEGTPKVSMEAAACGLPVIAFGCYEPPSIVDGKTGLLVWSDEELEDRLKQLVNDEGMRFALGANARDLACNWDWGRVADQWETHIVQVVRSRFT